MLNTKTKATLFATAEDAYHTHQSHPADNHFKWYWRGMETVLNHIFTVEEMKAIKGPVNYAREAGVGLVTAEKGGPA